MPLRGNLDNVIREGIRGWAQDREAPDQAVDLIVKVDGVLVQRFVATAFRRDLLLAKIGDGNHAFEIQFNAALSPERHVIEVLRERDGARVPGTPYVLEADSAVAAPSAKAPLPLRGRVDSVERHRIRGWALDPNAPDRPISLTVSINGQLITRVMANRYRTDLERAGIADGRRSFDVMPDPPLSPMQRHVIEVCREEDGSPLPRSPWILEAESSFTEDVQKWISQILVDAESDAAIQERLSFLTKHFETLLQGRADRAAKRIERQVASRPAFRKGNADAIATRAPGPLRALVIDERMPVSNRDAGSNAMRSHLRSLKRIGYDVSFAPSDMRAGLYEEIETLGITLCAPPWYTSVEEILRRQSNSFDLVYLHRLSMATQYAALVRRYQPRARLLYSVADLHHLRMRRQAEAQRRPELVALADRMQVSELITVSGVDGVITHSSHEANVLRRQVPAAKVYVVPWDVPVAATQVSFAQRKGMAFIGHYGHQPNLDAAQWLIDDIVPRLLERDPSFECLLVGTQLPEALRQARPGIVPIGEVENISEIFNRVRLTVAPLTYGAGIKGKLLDSLAAGVPCVGTSIASEGLDLPAELMKYIGDNASSLVVAIESLHSDAERNRAAAQCGLAYVNDRLSEARIDALMRDAVHLPAAAQPMKARG